MDLLILDANSSSRKILRGMLESIPYRSIRETSTLAELNESLKKDRSQLRLILIHSTGCSEKELSTFFSTLQAQSDLRKVALVYIGDDPELNSHPRVDETISTPFSKIALEQALISAFQKRIREFCHIALLTGKDSTEHNVGKMALYSLQNRFFNRMFAADSREQLDQLFSTHGERIAVLLVDPHFYARQEKDWLSHFKKTPSGAQTLTVSLSQDPRICSRLRSTCQIFLLHEPTIESWERNLIRLEQHLSSSWHIEIWLKNLSKLKKSQSKEVSKADLKEKNRLISLLATDAPLLPAGHIGRAQEFLAAESLEEAQAALLSAVAANPFFPEAYMMLLPLLKKKNEPHLKNWIENARAHCPAHPGVLKLIQELEA